MKKSLIITLIAIMLLSTATSCAKDAGTDTDKIVTTENSKNETTIDEVTILEPNLPEKNYNGEKFNFLVEVSGADQYTSREIYAENENGELINDAVFKRNLRIEEQFNIKITQTAVQNASGVAKKSLQAGDTEYDVVMPYLNTSIALAQEGLFMDLQTVPNLTLENPWWDQRANQNLIVNNKLFFTTGDISTLDNDCTMVMFFNKELLAENKLESPYDLVKNGKWTMDKLGELSNGITQDLNGDTKLDGEDLWGFFSANNAPHSMFFASGERIVDKDKDNNLQLVMNNTRSVQVAEKIFKLCYDKSVLSHQTKGADSFEKVCKIFTDGRVGFVTFALVDIVFLRDAKFDFGILPYPKFDESQKEYNHLISTGLVPAVCVPYNSKDPERVGIILESMAYNSTNTLTTAYYDNALNTRYVRDTESSDMLDIIFKTRVYDLGYIFNWGGLGSMLETMNNTKNTDFSSNYAKNQTKALAEMNKTITEFNS